MDYCKHLYQRQRLETREVQIGNLLLGAHHPIRVQSMTTTDTMETEKSVEQSIRMIEEGCELVRLTAPSKSEAENLKNIKAQLEAKGYFQPLVADIHFTPNAAEVATKYVEKIRVNPGNYADKKKFEIHDYTEETYAQELARIETRFTPLVLLCKEHKRAMRIGTNHGSLSDRILSKYGDTPEGMVASSMEFISICEKNDFYNLVISMKASNTLVMVQAYRLLAAEMIKNKRVYPLHLGVTEAGEGEDGRIKSAVGIGALLVDGLGDTIRVSLTEEPEKEIPVAQKLIEAAKVSKVFNFPKEAQNVSYNPFTYDKRHSLRIGRVGGDQVPVVIADLSDKSKITPANLFAFGYVYSPQLDKWNISDAAADFLYIGNQILDFELPGTLEVLVNGPVWLENYNKRAGFYPLVPIQDRGLYDINQTVFCLLEASDGFSPTWGLGSRDVLVAETLFDNQTQVFRYLFNELSAHKIDLPLILKANKEHKDDEYFQLSVSLDLGSVLIDGQGEGLWISAPQQANQLINSTAFGILQATRQRISKTEYISCPSCGRTLFDLQETTAKIREKTSHLKGLKIGIMGCIVNGPGEMADADYGYVGTGPGKIHLYKEQTVVRKNVPSEAAVEALIDLIKEYGDWVEPK